MLAKSIFTIGVTGHRDIEATTIKDLESSLDEHFKFIKSTIPDTEIRLISLMADGADRLAAKVAFQNDIEVDAILPMPMPLYETDFSSDSIGEFETLLANPLITLRELPLPTGIGANDTKVPEVRSKLYARAGRFMAAGCDLIVALWDGKESHKVGGTYHIIKSTVQNIALAHDDEETIRHYSYYKSALRDYKSTAIYHIPTARQSGTNANLLIKTPSYITRSDNENDAIKHVTEPPDELKKLFSQLNEYEEDVEKINGADLEIGSSPLISDVEVLNLSEEFQDYLGEIENYYSSSDKLAIFYQNKSDRSFKIISLLAFSLGGIFLTYAKLYPNPIILIGYVIVFGFGYVLFRKFKNEKVLEKHVKYRIVAETLRVKYFFTLAGIQNDVDGYTVEQFLRVNESKDFRVLTTFIRNSAKSIVYNPGSNINERVKVTINGWVANQQQYFSYKAKKNKSKTGVFEKGNFLVIITSLLFVVSLFLLPTDIKYYKIGEMLSIKSILTFLVGFLPMAAATYEHHSVKMAVSERAWQYSTMADIYNRTMILLQEAKTIEEYQNILKALGEEAIEENMRWMVLRLQRELQPATGG